MEKQLNIALSKDRRAQLAARGQPSYAYHTSTRDLTGVDYSDETPDVTYANHDLLGRPRSVTELRSTGNDVTTLSYDPISGAESSTYAATHSLLPGISLNAHDPDPRGYATGFAVRQTGNELHAWTATNDAFGRMTSLVSGNQNFSFQAQPGTRRVREQVAQIGGAIKHRSTRGIDMLGRVTGMLSRAPDPAAGDAERIVSSAGHTYDDGHRRKNTRREDGTIWEFSYNDRSEVTSAVKQAANSQLVPGQSFAYGFDAMGNRTSSTAGTAPNVATSGYTPNALNQFSAITTSGKLDVLARSDSPASFQVDGQNIAATRVGNLHNAHANVANSPNGKNVSVNVTANGSTQSGSRWIAPASVVPSYDADGNLKQDGRWSYTWDGENRLTKLQTLASAITAGAPNLTISYTYDFRSRKLRETLHDGSTLTQDERTLYDGWNPVAEFKGSAGVSPALSKTYLWCPDLSGTNQGAGGVGGLLAVRSATPVSGSSVFFPSYDTNGNIIAWSNESGQLIRRLDYDPFGNVVMKESFQGSTAELDQVLKHGFSTKPQNPESGLLYYGYRFYDPNIGRWLNRDPIEEEGGVNLYGFVGNDGVNRWDLLGMSKIGDVVDFYDNPEEFLTSKLEDFIKTRIPSYKIYSLASKIGAEMAYELDKSLKYENLIGDLALSVDDLHNLEECIIELDSNLNLDNVTVTMLNCCLVMEGHTTKIGYATLQYLKSMFPSLGKGIGKSLLKVGTGKIEVRIKKHFDATGYDLSKHPELTRDVGHFLIEQSKKEIDKIINNK